MFALGKNSLAFYPGPVLPPGTDGSLLKYFRFQFLVDPNPSCFDTTEKLRWCFRDLELIPYET